MHACLGRELEEGGQSLVKSKSVLRVRPSVLRPSSLESLFRLAAFSLLLRRRRRRRPRPHRPSALRSARERRAATAMP